MDIKARKAQSIVEYAIVLSVVIAALLIMQVFIKRGYQGGLKDSADKMGEQFSAGNTTINQTRNMTSNQTISDQVATTSRISSYLTSIVGASTSASDLTNTGVYSVQTRRGGNTTSETRVSTEAARQEATKISEYNNTSVTDFPAPF